MPVDSSGQWQPLLSHKQQEIRWMLHPENPAHRRFNMVSGPRRCGKTIGILHAMVEHAWLTPDAHLSLLTPTMSAGVDGGPWQSLIEYVIPQWIEEGSFGLEWHREPYISGATKKPMLSLKNIHGGVSKIQLDSVREGEREVAIRFKGKIFTMLVISEAASWLKERSTFDLLIEVFRKPGLDQRFNTLVLDTNPAEEGARHWAHQLFFEFAKIESCPENMLALQKELALLEVRIPDNPFLSEADVALLKAQYGHNPDLYSRYIEGKWTVATGDSLFHQVFRPTIHVLGGIETATNDNPDTLVPEENCFELVTGWDPGEVNHAVTILEPYKQLGKDSKSIETAFKVLDEVIFLESDMTIGDLTEAVVEKMAFWEKQIGKPVRWTHFSDRSVFDYRDSISARYQHSEVFTRSHGKIALQGIPKFDGSVRQRIDFLRKLLFQDRIFISNRRCPKIIESIQGLRKGKSTPIAPGSSHKHAFDALTYGISGVCYDEMEQAVRNVIAKPEKSEPILVSL